MSEEEIRHLVVSLEFILMHVRNGDRGFAITDLKNRIGFLRSLIDE